MVLIDTSIWISLYRKQSARVAQRLTSLTAANRAAVCGQVWVEFLGGFRDSRKRAAYGDVMDGYPWLDTPREAFELAAEWSAEFPALGPGDTIIAATAVTHDVPLLTLDRQFDSLVKKGLLVDRNTDAR